MCPLQALHDYAHVLKITCINNLSSVSGSWAGVSQGAGQTVLECQEGGDAGEPCLLQAPWRLQPAHLLMLSVF